MFKKKGNKKISKDQNEYERVKYYQKHLNEEDTDTINEDIKTKNNLTKAMKNRKSKNYGEFINFDKLNKDLNEVSQNINMMKQDLNILKQYKEEDKNQKVTGLTVQEYDAGTPAEIEQYKLGKERIKKDKPPVRSKTLINNRLNATASMSDAGKPEKEGGRRKQNRQTQYT